MKARLVPMYFHPGRDGEFDVHLNLLEKLLGDIAEFLDPVPVGGTLPDADAAIFPQMLGEAYSLVPELSRIGVPMMVITSDFGTVNMWDWEIVKFLSMKGIPTICPSSLEDTRMVCRGLSLKHRMKSWKIIAYQDDPAGPTGKQSEIFKRFYWLENAAVRRFMDKYGLVVEQRSFRDLAARAAAISDADAGRVADEWPSRDKSIGGRPLLSAVKLYMALDADYQAEKDRILAMGVNCLNESHSCDTTPCLAWNLLYEREKLVWGCEGDTMVMLSELLADKVVQAPFFMTNLYPFIMGKAALAHERIPYFPEVDEPENHVLAAHCGHFGLLPEVFSTRWRLKERVLAMVDENAVMIDADMPTGPITLVKYLPGLDTVSLSEGELTGYVQYEDSDCLNGGIIRLRDGRKFVDNVGSHHYIVMSGHHRPAFEMLGRVFDYTVEVI